MEQFQPLVLVVDDDELIVEALAEILADEGLQTARARNGVDALLFIADSVRIPDLIVLDMMMPRMDGWTFCRIRQRLELLKAIPVIAISADSNIGGRPPLGVEAILPKPFHPDDITRMVMRVVGSLA
jgi:CheY-like chemotaxis protein